MSDSAPSAASNNSASSAVSQRTSESRARVQTLLTAGASAECLTLADVMRRRETGKVRENESRLECEHRKRLAVEKRQVRSR